MASGKWHDRFNFLMLFVCFGLLISLGVDYSFIGVFVGGWLFSTLLFGPDTDIMPKKRTWLLGIFLYPYSLFSKHRGISHNLFLGTILRVIYGVLVFLFMVYVLREMGKIESSAQSFFLLIKNFILNFNFQEPQYLFVFWGFLGMWLADFCHLILDKVSI